MFLPNTELRLIDPSGIQYIVNAVNKWSVHVCVSLLYKLVQTKTLPARPDTPIVFIQRYKIDVLRIGLPACRCKFKLLFVPNDSNCDDLE